MIRLAIHGGAGTIRRDRLTPELEAAYREALADALRAGHAVLAAGGRAVDAVEAAVVSMEDCPLFNAGRGANFTAEGANELDAAIMDGRGRAAGAVAGVRRVRNPVRAARLVMERSGHVLLAGAGADAFAAAHGLEPVDPAYFRTERRWRALQRALAAGERGALSEDIRHPEAEERGGPDGLGTVGAVAVDAAGGLAAATSTGGLTAKRWGRVGDSPLVGAGTWADDATCAVSCTGVGEVFIRAVAAYDIAARMAYRGETLAEAAEHVVMKTLVALGGRGGAVAVDRSGAVAMPFNSEGMYRGVIGPEGTPEVAIYRD